MASGGGGGVGGSERSTGREAATRNVFSFGGTDTPRPGGGGRREAEGHDEEHGKSRRNANEIVSSPGSAQAVPASSRTAALQKIASPNVNYDMLRTLMSYRLKAEFGLNFDQDVRPYKDVPAKRIMPYRMRRVVSPFEFYLEFTNFPATRLYSKWFHEMQAFYRDSINRDKLKVIKGIPFLGRCYVCWDTEDGKWHRVRLHQVKEQSKELVVFYLDLCLQKETTLDNLLELEPRFSDSPAQVFRCYLHDILPAGKGHNSISWTPEACQYFEELVKGKEFTGIVITRSNTLITDGLPDVIADLGVVLVENAPGSRNPRWDVCSLNAAMVDAGFAVAIGVCAGCPHAFEIDCYKPAYDPSEFDHHFPTPSSSRAALQNDNQVSSNEQTGKKTAMEDLEEQLSKLKMKSRQDIAKVGLGDSDSHYKNASENLPSKIACRLAPIKIIFLVSPSCIFVHLKSQIKEMKAMQDGLKRILDSDDGLKIGSGMTDGKPGMLVACQILDPEESTDVTIWVRGVIMKANRDENTYRILIVDYGNEISVEKTYVRPLPTYFQDIPCFAVRLHVDVENVVPAGSAGWSSSATIEFRKYAFGWERFIPFYFIYRPPQAGIIELDHFGQQIMYNFGRRRWEPVYGRIPPSYQIISEMKDHPMVHNLLVSFGVELKYEIILNASHYWHFKTILDTLLEKGYAKEEQVSKNAAKLHEEISQAATSNQVVRLASSAITPKGSATGT